MGIAQDSRVAASHWFEKRESSEVAYLSVISCWEVAKLVQKRKLNFTIPLLDWVYRAVQLPGLTIVDLDPEISVASTQLPEPFHDDPADQIIVATARKLQVPIVTADKRLHAYPHVRTVW
ncbi:MAG TPA: type II toxin-antitoxin system VapC family toxin [Acidobacteriota bacterium]